MGTHYTMAKKFHTMEKQSSIIMLDYSLWTEDISIEMGLKPVPLQLEHVARNEWRRSHHSIHIGPYM